MGMKLLHNKNNEPLVRSAEGGASGASAVAAEGSTALANTSTRTLLLGIDKAGRIRQHDRGAGDVLSTQPGALIGTEPSSLLASPDRTAAATLPRLNDA